MRGLPRLGGAAAQLARRYSRRVAVVAWVAAVHWMAWSVVFELRARAILNARVAESSRSLAADNAVIAQAVAQLKAQLAAAPPRPSAAVQAVVAATRKMPEKPDPQWFKPSADGKCRDPVSGDRLQGAVALRGACWSIGGKIHPTDPCPDGWFEAPPEVDSEPQLQYLRNDCFKPMTLKGPQAASSGTP